LGSNSEFSLSSVFGTFAHVRCIICLRNHCTLVSLGESSEDSSVVFLNQSERGHTADMTVLLWEVAHTL
jgi:hypothetical protein